MTRKIQIVHSTPAMPEKWQEHGIPHGAIVRLPNHMPGRDFLVTDFTVEGQVILGWVNSHGRVNEYPVPASICELVRRPR